MTRPFNKARYKAFLDGLEISPVRFSDLIREIRIDAEFYKKRFLRLEDKLSHCALTSLGVESEKIKKGIFDINAACYSDKGVPFVRIGNLKNMMILEETLVHIPPEKDLPETHLIRGDVILSKTAYPAASLVTLPDCNVSQDIIAVKLKKTSPINTRYLVAFLNTRYGLGQMGKWFTGNVQMHFNLTDCKEIKIPLFSKQFQLLIADCFENGTEKKALSNTATLAATTTLTKALHLHNWIPDTGNISTNAYSSVQADRGRLDAEFYQPKYGELFAAICKATRYSRIANIETFNSRGLQPVYNKKGTLNVVTSKHILETTLDYGNFDKTHERNWTVQAKARIQKHDILTYTTGANIGRTQAYLSSEKALASNHVNILRVRGENPIYVAFVMNSVIGRLQTERLSSGSAQAELYPSDISQFLIPFVDKKTEQKIVDKVLESHELKRKSLALLEIAKQSVEIAIEESEAAAIKWIDAERRKLE